MNIKHILPILGLCGSIVAQAEDLSTEITVDRTVVAELPAASPLLSVFPSLLPVPASDVNIRPAQYGQASNFTPIAGHTDTPLFTGLPAPDGYRGYFWAGYFPAYNLGAAAGYRIIDKENTSLGAAVRFDGSSYKTKGFFQDKATVRDNTVGVQADFAHRFTGGARLSVDASYFHSALAYPVSTSDSEPQGINGADVRVGIARSGKVDYDASVRYSHFGLTKDVFLAQFSLPPATDNRFTADGRIGMALNQARTVGFRLGFTADFLKAYGWNEADNYRVYEDSRTSGILTVNPAFTFNPGKFDIRLGARLDIGVNSPDDAIHVAPDVTIAWLPSGKFSAYATFGGGEHFSTLAWQYQVSPFAPGLLASGRTFSPVDSRVGVNVRPIGNLSLGLFAGYSSVRRARVLSTEHFTFTPMDISGWNFGFDASYDFGRVADIHASARYWHHGDATFADRARATIDAGLTLKPIENLNVTADYALRACRRTAEGFNLHNRSDLSLGANYAFSPAFSVFLQLENLLCRRYMVVAPKIESQSLHGLAGISFRF